MEKKVLLVTLIGGALLLIHPVLAQTSPLDGYWTLENASVVKITGADTVQVDVSSVKEHTLCFLFDHLVFKADNLSFPDMAINGVFKREKNKIEITFTAAPYSLNVERAGDKLHFRQSVSSWGENFTYKVTSTYKKEK
jgi:hypothetical protein